MTSLLKSQILKHLTKFAKNLSPERIKINAFKGEGDVSNLELDEAKLTELLELPNWLKIKRAACNKVSIKIQWTVIKKMPIVLVLDEVFVSVEALETPRCPNKTKDTITQGPNNYGFIDRVIDGMLIKINLVRILFTAKTFKASMELTRVTVSSKMPNWSEADHLKKTRLKSVSQGCVLLFKEIEWDSTRIEASGLQDCQATPVKLITNTTKVRLTMKKSLTDQLIVESKVEFILIDLFWVLTISQIKAAILFTESLKEIISQSNEMNKEAAKIRLESSKNVPMKPEVPISDNPSNWSFTNSLNSRQKLFMKYDLKETSYHLLVSRVEFHFCEEGDQSSSLSKNSVVNGSVKFLLTNSQIDLYPYHVASMTREHFPNYKDLHRMRDIWLTNAYSQQTSAIPDDHNKLMESVTLIRFNDISMHCVSTAQKTNNCLFISSDIIRHKLPEKTTTFFLDITDHYYRAGDSGNLPETTIFCQINPLNLNLDWPTILWLNAFQLNLKNELNSSQYASSFLSSQELSNNKKTPALHIEAIMPRITLASDKVVTGQPDRPQLIQIQVGTLTIDNICQMGSDSDLIQQTIQEYQKSGFFSEHIEFFRDIVNMKNNPKKNNSERPRTLNRSYRFVWQICFDPLWIDYEGAKSYNNRSKACLDSIHMIFWISIPKEPNSDFGILFKFRDRLEIRFDHYQLLLLYRIMDSVSSALSLMQEDENGYPHIVKSKEHPGKISLVLQIDKLSFRIEWPTSSGVMNSVTNCSTPLNLAFSNPVEEDLSDTSDVQQRKNSKPIFEIEPLVFHNSHFISDKSRNENSSIRSRQTSPINIKLDGSPILQPNRRSYTSLMTINKSISNGKNVLSSTSNLLTYKSVKNLFSSGKLSRRGSQVSLNTSEAERMSMDSDTSDWISDGLLNELDLGEDPLNDSVNGISIEADGLLDSNSSSHSSSCWVAFDLTDFRLIMGIGDTTCISFGVFGNLVINESKRSESNMKSKFDTLKTEDINVAKILGRIDYPPSTSNDESPLTIDIRFVKDMDQSVLMSSIVSISEIFEDEISPSEKYSEKIKPPVFRINLTSSLNIEMIEDRPCDNISCPSEHSNTLLKLPPGMSIIIEGATVVLFEFSPVSNNHENLTNGPILCHRCNQRFSAITSPNSPIPNQFTNSFEHIKTERNATKKTEYSSSHLKTIWKLQQQNKMYQDEIIKLRLELQNVLQSQNDLRNLIRSPSTHFI